MSLRLLSMLFFMFFAVTAKAAPQLVYLSCELPSEDGKKPTDFDFTLDEQNSTVSFYVELAEKTNTEKAVFGPNSVTWTSELPLSSTLTRTINRVDLSFTEYLNLAGHEYHKTGHCSLVKSPPRQF